MRNERLLQTLILAAAGLALFGFLRPASPDPVEDASSRKTWFFINKAHQGPEFDAVIIGDSRALRGVSPAAMSTELDGLGLYNFSFHAGGMNREMFQAGERLLREDLARPVIVLIPTALSFLPSKAANAQFHEFRAKPRDQVWIYRHIPELAHWFQPVSPSVYLRRALGIRPRKALHQEFMADGWIASEQEPRDDVTDLSVHCRRLVGQSADPARIAEFMDQTGQWTARGIKVFGLFPPAFAARVAMEDSMLGLDRADFIARFRAAGGIWLDPAGDRLETYDGSHLDRASARKFSRNLARDMAPHL